MVSFGSSFNVVERPAALREVKRIAVARGWFACRWNHRDLDDPLQKEVEATIVSLVPGYGYGVRREDQTAVIEAIQSRMPASGEIRVPNTTRVWMARLRD